VDRSVSNHGLRGIAGRLTKDVDKKTNEAVVRGQRQQNLVDEYYVLEVVYDSLAVEKVHGGSQPVPVQALGRTQLPRPARNARNRYDFAEGHDLDGRDNENDVYVTHEEGRKEAPDHDEGPEGARHEVGPLLLVFGLLLDGRQWLLLASVSFTTLVGAGYGAKRATIRDRVRDQDPVV
jgi:hypothetical protein